ncbi:MAG: protein translocase subunit SecD [Gammaproteobacteria bacterium]|nr:protein translocase subunit SecD [Gammaproteobacteria bacterium]
MSTTIIKNETPKWLWLLIIVFFILALVYALPNIYGESPSLQISSKDGSPVTFALVSQVTDTLNAGHIKVLSAAEDTNNLTLRFKNTDDQMAAEEILRPGLTNQMMAVNLTPNTPSWLRALGGAPMKLGLDLQGGMYILLDLDMQALLQTHMQDDATSIMNDLREANIHYSTINTVPGEGVVLGFSDLISLQNAQTLIQKNDPDLNLIPDTKTLSLVANLSGPALKVLQDNAVNQTLQVMRNRVNELGVAEASVAKDSNNRIVIEMPGVQDATQAQSIIGGTATLKAMLVNDTVNAAQVLASGNAPAGSSIYDDQNGNGVVLYNPVIITGNAISDASVGYDQQTGAPIVQISLTGPEVNYFSQVTGQNAFDQEELNGKIQTVTHVTQTVINVATIQSQLGSHFQITGIGNARAAQNLALSIRAGALPVPVQVAEEKQIGPSLGIQNIKMGALSVAVALGLILIFIAIYYRVFGLIAGLCLILNLIFIVAVMSLLPGATLTLPGIAGVVLNVGMAIDANVLIFERIREELRKGSTNMLAIHTGYERAFGTIIDANVTTFIVAVILFAIGTGAVKGFAVTLMIGIVTSVFCAVVVGRACINWIYGRHPKRKLSIGI